MKDIDAGTMPTNEEMMTNTHRSSDAAPVAPVSRHPWTVWCDDQAEAEAIIERAPRDIFGPLAIVSATDHLGVHYGVQMDVAGIDDDMLPAHARHLRVWAQIDATGYVPQVEPAPEPDKQGELF